VHDLYEPDFPDYTALSDQRVADSIDRTIQMLKAASDMAVDQVGDNLNVTVTNWSGHKLPTGFPDGRRMWINAVFYDSNDVLLEEIGGYDYATADLDTDGTEIYEMKLGIDETVAAETGLEAGESFHLVLVNEILKDNRIPPVGFTNAGFEAIQASPVEYSYADGQHWDDTIMAIPEGAKKAVVTLYFQTSSKEYMEFLRDGEALSTDGLIDYGQIAYDAWVNRGKSAPVAMDSLEIDLYPEPIPSDIDNDGDVDVNDLLLLISDFGCTGDCIGDINGDLEVDVTDVLILLQAWTAS